MRLSHLIHRDPNWQQRGLYSYYQCQCGARRVRQAVTNLSGPVEPGWPRLADEHGRRLNDSGWRQPTA